MSDVDAWVSQEFQNLAQVIYDYDENLRLEWVPPVAQQLLTDKSKVFKVVDTRNGKIVMYADSLANPVDILARIFSMDQKHGNVVARLDARNAAAQALELSKKIDERAAAIDFSAFIVKNTKSRWTHEGRVRDDEFRDLGPVRTVIDK